MKGLGRLDATCTLKIVHKRHWLLRTLHELFLPSSRLLTSVGLSPKSQPLYRLRCSLSIPRATPAGCTHRPVKDSLFESPDTCVVSCPIEPDPFSPSKGQRTGLLATRELGIKREGQNACRLQHRTLISTSQRAFHSVGILSQPHARHHRPFSPPGFVPCGSEFGIFERAILPFLVRRGLLNCSVI